MPGFQRAQQNWRRAASLTARVSLNPHPARTAPSRDSLVLLLFVQSFCLDSRLRKCHFDLIWFFSVLPAIDKLINIEPDAFVPKTISDENLWSLVQRDLLHGDVCRLATGSNTIPFQLFYIYFTYIWFLFNIYITDGAGSNTILFHLFNSFEFGAYFGWFGLNLEASRHFKF